MTRFDLTEKQAQAILDMRLQKLTSLETKKIVDELEEVRALIRELKELLASEEKIRQLIKSETQQIADTYGDERRTEIVPDEIEHIDIEDLIQREDMVVVISHRGYIKRVPLTSYRSQGRGGKGLSSSNLMEDDFIQHIFIGSTHDHILFLTNEGKAYWLKVHEIPEGSRAARGAHIRGLLQISANDEIAAVVSIEDFSDEQFLFFATAEGRVKKVRISEFSNAKKRGITAINLRGGDRVIRAQLTSGTDEMMIVTRAGNGLRFREDEVRVMGRSSQGVQGIRLREGDEVAGCTAVSAEEEMLLVTEFGYGKRSSYEEFSVHGRGTRGQTAYGGTDRTGEVVGVVSVRDGHDVMIITSQGNTIKVNVSQITRQGRSARGVRLVDIESPDYVVALGRAGNGEERNAGSDQNARSAEDAGSEEESSVTAPGSDEQSGTDQEDQSSGEPDSESGDSSGDEWSSEDQDGPSDESSPDDEDRSE
jgi:DNA gyrase subunit A